VEQTETTTTTTATTTTTDNVGATSASTKPPPKVYYGQQQPSRRDADGNIAAAAKTTPKINGHAKEWKPQRLWRDIYDSLCAAQKLIYIVGWSVDHTQSLLRGEEQRQALERYQAKSGYSPILGQLLQQKADEEGVTVNVMVWDDMTNNLWGVEQGVMKTHDEALRVYFRKSKVNVLLAPIPSRHLNPFIGMRNAVTLTHHQKMIVCDDSATHELVGYVGGVDLTGGRYEDGTYPLFRTLQTDHKDDFYNGCAAVTAATGGPRQPWHDIHARVTGGAVLLDLVQNFEERWRKQAPSRLATSALVDLGAAGIRLPVEDRHDRGDNAPEEKESPLGDDDDDDESWSCQLFRSIDDRTAKFDAKFLVRKPMDLEKTQGIAEVPVRDQDDLVVHLKTKKDKVRRRKRDRIRMKGKKIRAKLERFFEGESVVGFSFDRFLNQERGVSKDASVQEAMVHHIRRAEHCIYIESQYFLSSSHFWSKDTAVHCSNLVAAEITLKICAKIHAGQRFAAYILVPMWSEGIPESKAVQSILYWQYRTMESMYQRIAAAIQKKKEAAACIGDTFDAEPTDYLNFYCLGQRETAPVEFQTQTSARHCVHTASELLSRTRRHLVYVHSKMVIVDDAVALVGSANINQRSLDGSRDSEIVLGCWQQKYLADQQDIARGDVHGFRLQCFAHIMGVLDEAFRHPSSLECVHRVNEIARTNWNTYTSDDVVRDMHPSFVLPYPIAIDTDTGSISAATENGCFPDTNARILGSRTILPEFLTT
jgi:phospholipase D1/2